MAAMVRSTVLDSKVGLGLFRVRLFGVGTFRTPTGKMGKTALKSNIAA